MAEPIEFTAVIEQQRFYNENSHWGVFVFSTEDEIPETYECGCDPFDDNAKPKHFSTLAGNMQKLNIGGKYTIKAELELNKKYNQWQYKPIMITSPTPNTKEEQQMYLRTQVTAKQADSILAVYPNIVNDVIEGKEIDVTNIKGIGEKTWQKIKDNIIENYGISDILVMLQPLGVTYKQISKLISNSISPALLKEELLDNPYMLVRIKGIGFRKADQIALKLNPDIKVSLKRTTAFINTYLTEVGNDSGHTYITLSELKEAVANEIPECIDIYTDFIDRQGGSSTFLKIVGDKVGLLRYYDREKNILEILKEIDSYDTNFKLDIEKGIADAEKAQGFEFTSEQKDVISRVCSSNVAIFTGKSGTGKSTILRAITTIYANANYSIACCALSAKAAQRISETTNRTASTIHRLLGFKGTQFSYCADNRLPVDIIIVDETSMINSSIFFALVQAIKEGSRIIMCGDDGQLPPIGEGNIFHDLLKYNDVFTCCYLTKILRQAAASGIVSDASKIRNNESPLQRPELKTVTGELQDMTYMFRENREGMRDIAIKQYLKIAESKGTDDICIITPCKQNRVNSTMEINNIIQDKLIPDTERSISYGTKTFRIGAKVIQRTNNYELNVFNGEVGYVKDIFKDDNGTNIMQVDFGDDKIIDFEQSLLSDIELAYALTCHLTQGSEYPNVICIVDNTHFKLLDSCLLYTAITRAKKRCLLIAEPQAFRRCISNKASNRNTWLDLMRKENLNDTQNNKAG